LFQIFWGAICCLDHNFVAAPNNTNSYRYGAVMEFIPEVMSALFGSLRHCRRPPNVEQAMRCRTHLLIDLSNSPVFEGHFCFQWNTSAKLVFLTTVQREGGIFLPLMFHLFVANKRSGTALRFFEHLKFWVRASEIAVGENRKCPLAEIPGKWTVEFLGATVPASGLRWVEKG